MASVSVFRPTVVKKVRGEKTRIKSKVWWGKWRDPSGKVRTESLGTRSKDVAKRIAKKKEDELALDPWGLATPKRVLMPWGQFVEEFVAYKLATNRPGTANAYRMSLDPVTRILDPKYVSAVATVPVLQQFVQKRATEVAPETVNKDLRAIRAALRYAADDGRGYIPKAPAFKTLFLRTNLKHPVCLAPDVQAKLVAAATSEDFQPRFRSRRWWQVFVNLVRETGARRGELLGLEWDRVDFGARTIKITAETSKGRRDRVLPLGAADELWALLKGWREEVGGTRVFPWEKTTFRQFYEDWGRLLAAGGLPDGVVPKNLRSTTGSELVAAGVPTVAVKDWLGHSSVTTTERYYANTGQALRQAAEQRRKWRDGP